MLDYLKFWKNNKQIKEGPAAGGGGGGGGSKISAANLKQFFIKAIGGGSGSTSSSFESPEYDLTDIKTASVSDSYVKVALQKHSQLIFKAGYTINSTNDNASEYIRTRLRGMSFACSKPTDMLFLEIGEDLNKYSNAFLVKSRVDKVMGGVNAKGVYNNKPVGGYFRMDPSTIQIKRDANGTVQNYQQQVGSNTKSFNALDVIHFYIEKEGGAAFGTPRIVAVLEDVKLLRQIEGNVLSLIYRFAIPIYQWMIGLTQAGFMATSEEMQEAQNAVQKMPMDGVIITNERTQIKAIGAEGVALDATGYLSYFEKRVFTGLNVSEAMMGRGGAKQDADSMEGQVHDTVKYIQRVISIFARDQMFVELLLEGGFDPINNADDIVTLDFNEINLDTKVKMENHEMLKFQSSCTTFEEMRQNLGMNSDTVDETRLWFNMVEKDTAIAEIEAKLGEAQPAASSASAAKGTAGNGKTKSAKPNGAATNNNRPTNQHGTSSVKIKESLNITESDEDNKKINKNEEKYKIIFQSVYKKYHTTRNDILKHPESADIVLPVAKDSIVKELKQCIEMSVQDGINKAYKENNQSHPSRVEKTSTIVFEKIVEKTVTDLFKDIKKRIKGKDNTETTLIFGTLEYRLRFLSDHITRKAYWYGYIKGAASMGIEKVEVDFDGSEDEKNHNKEIDTSNFSLSDIPSYHAYCDCRLQTAKGGEKK